VEGDKEMELGNVDIRPTKPTVKRDISSSLGTIFFFEATSFFEARHLH
jgi:hypothetical protein